MITPREGEGPRHLQGHCALEVKRTLRQNSNKSKQQMHMAWVLSKDTTILQFEIETNSIGEATHSIQHPRCESNRI